LNLAAKKSPLQQEKTPHHQQDDATGHQTALPRLHGMKEG
jgi:hypothetical protein